MSHLIHFNLSDVRASAVYAIAVCLSVCQSMAS